MHPLRSVPHKLYVVAIAGVTTIELVVAVVDHKKGVEPLAVRVLLCPVQTEYVPVIVGVGITEHVIIFVSVDIQPLTSFAIAVRVVVPLMPIEQVLPGIERFQE